MKKITALLFACLFGLFAVPMAAEAHVKWFTDYKPAKETIDHIISPLFIMLALSVAVLVALLVQLLPVLNSSKYLQKIDQSLDQLRKYSFMILKYGLAAALLIQIASGSLFVPEFQIHTQLESVLLWAAIILLLMPYHFCTKAGALVILY
jgi:hypothetical protein